MEHAIRSLPRRMKSSRTRARTSLAAARGRARLSKMHGSGKATFKLKKAPEKLVIEVIDRLEKKIKAFKLQMVDRSIDREH